VAHTKIESGLLVNEIGRPNITKELLLMRVLRILETWMDYCEGPARSCEHLNFTTHLSLSQVSIKQASFEDHFFFSRSFFQKIVCFCSTLLAYFSKFITESKLDAAEKNQATSQRSLG
jgi:hypothetical protein